MDDAGRGNQLVCGITFYIQPTTLAAYLQRQRPGVDSPQSSRDFNIIKVDLDPTKLGELAYFPEHDRRNAPSVR
jgi:hypothetical protein